MPSRPEPRPHFSMIRGFQLADFFTLGNAACGVAAVLMAMRYLGNRERRRPARRRCLRAGGVRLRRPRRPDRALAPDVVGARPRARFARRRHLVRRRARHARVRVRDDGRLGRGDPRLLRLLRRLAPGALQRHRRVALGRQRQGQVLRGNADPDQRAADGAARLGDLAGTHRQPAWSAARGRCSAPTCTRSRCCSRCRERS